MKPKKSESNASRFLILVLLSVLAGILSALVGYWIGQYYYVLFVYPFVLLIIGLLLYLPVRAHFGIQHRLRNVLCGLAMGLTIFVTFHYIEYTIFRSKALQIIELSQHVGEAAASKTLDAFLVQKSGLSGFPGFMKNQQSQLRPYVYYFTRRGEITQTLEFYLREKTAWLYLAGEAAVLLGGMAVLGLLGAESSRSN